MLRILCSLAVLSFAVFYPAVFSLWCGSLKQFKKTKKKTQILFAVQHAPVRKVLDRQPSFGRRARSPYTKLTGHCVSRRKSVSEKNNRFLWLSACRFHLIQRKIKKGHFKHRNMYVVVRHSISKNLESIYVHIYILRFVNYIFTYVVPLPRQPTSLTAATAYREWYTRTPYSWLAICTSFLGVPAGQSNLLRDWRVVDARLRVDRNNGYDVENVAHLT